MDNAYDSLRLTTGFTGIAYLLTVLVCITLAWWALQQLRLEVFLKNPRSTPAKVLLIMASIALGYQVASFIIAYITWTGMMKGMFGA